MKKITIRFQNNKQQKMKERRKKKVKRIGFQCVFCANAIVDMRLMLVHVPRSFTRLAFTRVPCTYIHTYARSSMFSAFVQRHIRTRAMPFIETNGTEENRTEWRNAHTNTPAES